MTHWGITPPEWSQLTYWQKLYMIQYYVAAKQRARLDQDQLLDSKALSETTQI